MVTRQKRPSIFARETTGDKILIIFLYVMLTFVSIAVLYPVIFVVSSSLSSPNAVSSGKVVLWPVEFSTQGYELILQYRPLWMGFANSACYAIFGGIISTAITLMAAYPLSRKDLIGRNPIMIFMTFTMFFGGGLIPTYLLMVNLGLINTRWVMIVPGAVGVFNVIIARTFMQSNIPQELHDAAQVDGCSDFSFFWRVVLPLSKPLIAILFLFAAVGAWNAYFEALIYLNSENLMPIQIVLRSVLIEGQRFGSFGSMAAEIEREKISALLKFGMIVIGSLPLLIAYPFVQKYFVKGMLIGSIKG